VKIEQVKFEQKIKVPTISLISMINVELGIQPILEDNPRSTSMALMRRIRGKYKDFQIILRRNSLTLSPCNLGLFIIINFLFLIILLK
jgi:hypothetical protein